MKWHKNGFAEAREEHQNWKVWMCQRKLSWRYPRCQWALGKTPDFPASFPHEKGTKLEQQPTLPLIPSIFYDAEVVCPVLGRLQLQTVGGSSPSGWEGQSLSMHASQLLRKGFPGVLFPGFLGGRCFSLPLGGPVFLELFLLLVDWILDPQFTAFSSIHHLICSLGKQNSVSEASLSPH